MNTYGSWTALVLQVPKWAKAKNWMLMGCQCLLTQQHGRTLVLTLRVEGVWTLPWPWAVLCWWWNPKPVKFHAVSSFLEEVSKCSCYNILFSEVPFMKLHKFSLIPFKWGSHEFQALPESSTISIIVGTEEVHYSWELLEWVSVWDRAWKKFLGCPSSLC